jgi:hypothetical protein
LRELCAEDRVDQRRFSSPGFPGDDYVDVAQLRLLVFSAVSSIAVNFFQSKVAAALVISPDI